MGRSGPVAFCGILGLERAIVPRQLMRASIERERRWVYGWAVGMSRFRMRASGLAHTVFSGLKLEVGCAF